MPAAPARSWGRVLRNRQAARDTFWIEMDCAAAGAAARPGQFVMLGTGLGDVAAPFLPRPFSIAARAADGRLGFFVRVFGAGTRRLSTVRPGDELLVLGPLGRPFRLCENRPVLCLAGGVGLAPFLFVAAEARRAGREVRIVYGERSADRVFDPALVREIADVNPDLRTEDGSLGLRGSHAARVRRARGRKRASAPGFGRGAHGLRRRHLSGMRRSLGDRRVDQVMHRGSSV